MLRRSCQVESVAGAAPVLYGTDATPVTPLWCIAGLKPVFVRTGSAPVLWCAGATPVLRSIYFQTGAALVLSGTGSTSKSYSVDFNRFCQKPVFNQVAQTGVAPASKFSLIDTAPVWQTGVAPVWQTGVAPVFVWDENSTGAEPVEQTGSAPA